MAIKRAMWRDTSTDTRCVLWMNCWVTNNEVKLFESWMCHCGKGWMARRRWALKTWRKRRLPPSQDNSLSVALFWPDLHANPGPDHPPTQPMPTMPVGQQKTRQILAMNGEVGVRSVDFYKLQRPPHKGDRYRMPGLSSSFPLAFPAFAPRAGGHRWQDETKANVNEPREWREP